MVTTKDWKQYFPYPEIRPIQEKSINLILNSFVNSNIRYFLLNGPPGSGKSAIAITISKYFENIGVSNSIFNKTSWILTTQKILQQQYQKDFSWLPSVWSKSNYECVKRVGVSCQLGLWMNSIFKGTYCNCVYLKDKKKFLEGNISLTNISFFINHVEYGHGEISQRKLLIVDECHVVDESITNFVSIKLNKYIILDYGILWVGASKSIQEVVLWIKTELLPPLTILKNKISNDIKASDKNTILGTPEGRNLVKRFDDIDRYMCQLNRCVERFNKDEWVMSINSAYDEISLKPIFSSRYSYNQLFCMGEKILLMSGTLLDKETFCRNVGIPEHNAEFVSLESPFELKNRPIFYINVGSMSYKNIDETLPKMVVVIKDIIFSEDHKRDKGIIFSHTYKNAKYIYDHIKTKRFLLHDSSNRMEVYNFHLNSKEPTILLSPSLSEGIDLFDNISRFQIIVKVPFPYLGDKFVIEKMKRIKNWYNWETIKTIIQASGRSIRNVDDYSITYILDKDFEFFYKNNISMFPVWWRNSVQSV